MNRESIASLALITRQIDGQTEYLLQSHRTWRGFTFVGGHVESGESFRDCLVREITEELLLQPCEFCVGQEPEAHLCYSAYSRSAETITDYSTEISEVTIPDQAILDRITAAEENRWYPQAQINAAAMSLTENHLATMPDQDFELSPSVPATMRMIARTETHPPVSGVVGITGHRDLIITDEVKRAINDALTQYADECGIDQLTVLSPLADGADQLVAEIAWENGHHVVAPLPLPCDLYRDDFDADGKERLTSYLGRCRQWFCIPRSNNHTRDKIKDYGAERNQLYEAVGQLVADRSGVLLALWDGEHNGKQGGTSEILRYARQKYGDDPGRKIIHIPVARASGKG